MPEDYVKCPDCGKEMSPGNGCDLGYLEPAERGDDVVVAPPVDRLRYGCREEECLDHDGKVISFAMFSPTCHDCGAGPGQFHHFGCDVERCPICKGQLISCGHVFNVPVEGYHA